MGFSRSVVGKNASHSLAHKTAVSVLAISVVLAWKRIALVDVHLAVSARPSRQALPRTRQASVLETWRIDA